MIEILVPTESDHALDSLVVVVAAPLVCLMMVLPRTVAEILVAKLTQPLFDRMATLMTVMATTQTTMTMSYTRQSRSTWTAPTPTQSQR